MTSHGYIVPIVIGFLIIGASIYVAIMPPASLAQCTIKNCSLAAPGIGFLLGILFIIIGGAIHHKQQSRQTVTISLSNEAEADAAALSNIERAVGKGESAEGFVPVQRKEKLVVPPEVFAALSKDQMAYKKERKKATPPKTKEKQKTIQLPKDILRAAKKSRSKSATKKKK